MEAQWFNRAWLILVAAAVLLLLYPVVYQQAPLLQAHFKDYHFFRQFLRAPADTTNQVELDSLPGDTVAVQAPAPKYRGLEGLGPFFAALRRRGEQIRIAHYGDSSIEGDLITGSFRDSLQRRFGGSGVGFAPIVNPISGFRRSLLHNFSDNWHHCYLGVSNEQGLARGLAGDYASTWTPPPDRLAAATDSLTRDSSASTPPADEGHWVFYGGAKLFAGARTLPSARLFYAAPLPDSSGSRPAPGSVYFKLRGRQQRYSLDGNGLVNELLLSDTTTRRLSLYFNLPPTQALYGVSLESPDGVIVDNFPSRGNIGGALLYIKAPVLRSFQEHLDYDLVMLQFGLNALNKKMTDYSWYQREMTRVIRYFRKAMPQAAILVIGPSDRAIKIQGRMQTDPSVPILTEALRRAAEATDVGFFSFYEAMGGDGSMVEWVEERRPRLANLDYTHFNFAGARQAALLLLEYLLEGYDDYLEAYKRGEVLPSKSN